MADWSLPTLETLYTEWKTALDGRLVDVSLMFDSGSTAATNIPTGAKRWNSSASKFEKYNGTSWSDLASVYAISISGNAATATTSGSCTGNAATSSSCLGNSATCSLASAIVDGAITDSKVSSSSKLYSRISDTKSLRDYGAVCDGVTNDTSAVQAAIAAIGSSVTSLLIPGPTKINTSLTFGAATELVFSANGRVIGTSGTELIQVQRQIVAGPHTCFVSCVPRGTSPQSLLPEWFGAVKDGTTDDTAAFNAAMNFLQYTKGLIQLAPGYYAISNSVLIAYSGIVIQGAGNNVSFIKVTGTNGNGVIVNGTSSSRLSNIMLRDFSIIAASPSTGLGLGLNFAAFPIVERMQIQDFLNGVYMEGATNSQLTKVGATYTGSSNDFIGFNIYGGVSGAISANASSILRDCYASGAAGLTGQIGFKLHGSYMSDVQLDTCETALTNYGYYLDYSIAPDYNVDIIIRNPIVDRYYTQGILVNALPSNGILQIIGGYTNPETTGAPAQNIYLNNCVGAITTVGHEFMALTNIIYTDGLYMIGCSGVSVSGCIFSMLNRGIHAVSSGYSTFTSNIFMGRNPSSFSSCIGIVGGARIMVNSNTLSGASSGVVIDATSSGCGIVGNTANVATVATRFTNNGSGAIGGVDGSTGLNSGV